MYCGLRVWGSLSWPQLVFTLGFYTYQAAIWRSILTAGSADSPFGCYPISLGRRSLHNCSITFPGFLPRKRTFQRSIRAAAPHLICNFYLLRLSTRNFTLVTCFFLYNLFFQVSKQLPHQSELSFGFLQAGEGVSSICVCFRIDTLCPSISSDHIPFGQI